MTDIHNHTVYSDGENTIREMIENSLTLGIDTIGFADHSRALFYRKNNFKYLTEYIEELNTYKNIYKNQINILSGIEINVNFDSIKEKNELPFALINELDFALFEHVDGTEPNKEITEFCLTFNEMTDLRKKLKCRAGLSHTLLSELIQKNYKNNFNDSLNNLIQLMKKNKIFWELNISTNHQTYDEFIKNPLSVQNKIILQTLMKNEVEIIPGSDRHFTGDIDIDSLRYANDISNKV